MPEEVVQLPSGTSRELLNSGEMEIQHDESDQQKKLEKAQMLFGEDFYGQKEVETTLNITINPENIPKMQFTYAELTRAHELGHQLVLRVSETATGEHLTPQWLEGHLQPSYTERGERIFAEGDQRHDQNYYKFEVPRNQWAIVSKNIIPNSEGKNYLEQTETLVRYVTDVLYSNIPLPADYEKAVSWFTAHRDKINTLLMSGDVSSSTVLTPLLTQLSINQLTRHSATDMIYDYLLFFRKKFPQVLVDYAPWTTTHAEGHNIVRMNHVGIGSPNKEILFTSSSAPGEHADHIATFLSLTHHTSS